MKNVSNFLKGSAFGTVVLLGIYLPLMDAEGPDRGVIPTSSFFAPMEVKMPKIANRLEVTSSTPTPTPLPTVVLVRSLEQKKPSVLAVSTMSAVTPTSEPTIAPTATPVYESQPVYIAAASAIIPFDELFTKYAALYNVDKNLLVHIARCESGFRSEAINGPYLGMFQYQDTTWSSTRTAMGENPDPALRANPEEAIKTSAWKIANGGIGAWPVCGKS